MDFHGLAVQDLRSILPRSSAPMHGPLTHRALGHITGIAVHWDAVARPHDYDSVARYVSEANYHINEDWGNGWHGDGLMYHFKIDNTGVIFYTRDIAEMLWAVSDQNPFYINICVDSGADQQPTREQAEALQALLDELCFNHPEFPASQADVRGHLEVPSNATACPGSYMPMVISYRNEKNTHPELYAYDYPPVPTPVTQPVAEATTPIVPDAHTSGQSVSEPVPVTSSVLDNLPDYETSFVEEPGQKQVIFPDTFAVDAQGALGPISIPEKVVVNVSGYFQSNGKTFYRLANSVSHPEVNGLWYGISADSLGSDTNGDQSIPITLPEAPAALPSFGAFLASLLSPLLRLVGFLFNRKPKA